MSECDKEIYERGTILGMVASIPAKELDEFLIKVSEEAGAKVDFHYFAGRAVIKTLPENEDKVMQAFNTLIGEWNTLKEKHGMGC